MTEVPKAPWQYPDYNAAYDRALMAYAAYADIDEIARAVDRNGTRQIGEFHLEEDFKWQLLGDERDRFIDRNDTSGLVAVAFEHPRDKHIVIVFRGSDDLATLQGPDIKADAALMADGELLAIAGRPSPKTEHTRDQMAAVQKAIYGMQGDQWHPQFTDALDYANRLREKYEPAGYTFEVVGHSLGGSHSELVAHTFGWPGRSFDALGAQNLAESQGYKTWLAAHGIERPAGAPAYDQNNPQDVNFLNYGARWSIPAQQSGPHLGDSQVVSSLSGRQGVRQHLTYAASAVDAAISEVPLVGDLVAARSGLRAARMGELGSHVAKEAGEHMLRSGVDAPAKHSMARLVRVFETAARENDLPTFGQDELTPDRNSPRQTASAPSRGSPARARRGPADSDHPDHAMLEQIQEGVRAQPDPRLQGEAAECASHCLLAKAKESGLRRVDQVGMGTDGRLLFVVEGDTMREPWYKRAHVEVDQAIRTPVEQSDARLEDINKQLARQQDLARQQEMARGPDDPTRGGPVMR